MPKNKSMLGKPFKKKKALRNSFKINLVWSLIIANVLNIFSPAIPFLFETPIAEALTMTSINPSAGGFSGEEIVGISGTDFEQTGYVTEITLNNNRPDTLTDQIVRIKLDTATMISEGKMQNNCADIRVFADQYMHESLTFSFDSNNCNQSDSELFVQVPEIDPDQTKIYLYSSSQRNLTSTSDNNLVPLTPNLTTLWKFEESGYDTCQAGQEFDICDVTGNGNHATIGKGTGLLTNTTEEATFGPGYEGNGLIFDGTDDYFYTPNDLTGTGEFTINYRLFPNTFTYNGNYYTLNEADTSLDWESYFYRYYSSIYHYWQSASCSLDPYSWHNYTYVYKNPSYDLYIDGTPCGSSTYSLDHDDNRGILFGKRYNNNNFYFSGIVDEIAFFDVALDATSVQDLNKYGTNVRNLANVNVNIGSNVATNSKKVGPDVSFDTTTVPSLFYDSSFIEVKTPYWASAESGSDLVDITLTNPIAVETQSYNDAFNFNNNVSFETVEPEAGPEAGGTAIVISGANFPPTSTYDITINGISATNITYIDSRTITATTPANTAGTYTVVLSIDSTPHSLSEGFSYHDSTNPIVTSVNPQETGTSAGTEIIVKGANFQPPGYRIEVEFDNRLSSEEFDKVQSMGLSTTELIAEGFLQPDCSNIRVVDEDDQTVLPHTLENCNHLASQNQSTVIFSKFPYMPADSTGFSSDYEKSAYLVIDPSFKKSEADPNELFLFYDDFELGEFDSNKWEQVGTDTGGNWFVTDTEVPYGNYKATSGEIPDDTYTEIVTIPGQNLIDSPNQKIAQAWWQFEGLEGSTEYIYTCALGSDTTLPNCTSSSRGSSPSGAWDRERYNQYNLASMYSVPSGPIRLKIGYHRTSSSSSYIHQGSVDNVKVYDYTNVGARLVNSSQASDPINNLGSPHNFQVEVGSGGSFVTPSNVEFIDNYTAKLTLPALSTGLKDVRVTNHNTTTVTKSNAFEVTSDINVTGISRNNADSTEIFDITINGPGIGDGVTAKLSKFLQNEISCYKYQPGLNSITCRFNLENVSVGKWDLIIEAPNGSSHTEEFFINDSQVPTISSITPEQGPQTISSQIYISGSNFRPSNYITDLTVSNPENTNLSDEIIHFKIDTTSLVEEGKINLDCSDVRFIDNDQNTYLDYWVEDCDSTYTSFWIKIPILPAAGTTIYFLYGDKTRSAVSDPANIFPAFTNPVSLRLKADSLLDLYQNNSFIPVWKDQSGNGNDVSNPDIFGMPRFFENRINGLPVVSFSGTNDFLRKLLPNNMPHGDVDKTIVTLVNVLNNDHNKYGGVIFGYPEFDYASGNASRNGNYVFNYGGYLDDQYTGINGFDNKFASYVTIHKASDNNLRALLNNVEIESTSITLENLSTAQLEFAELTIGSTLNQTHFQRWDLADVIVFNGALNDSELSSLQKYYDLKYNLKNEVTPQITVGTEISESPRVVFSGTSNGDLYATDVVVSSDGTQISANTPIFSALETVDVSVNNLGSPSATLFNSYEILNTNAPQISSVNLLSGILNSGNISLSVLGNGFQVGSLPGTDSAELKLIKDSLELPCINYTTVTSSELSCEINLNDPTAEHGLWDIVVTNPSGNLSATYPDQFRISTGLTPTITSLNPEIATAGDTVQIQGSDFHPNATLEIDGEILAPSEFTYIDANNISFTVPDGFSTVPVKVINPDNIHTTATLKYEILISSLSLTEGRTNKTHSVTATGSDMGGITRVIIKNDSEGFYAEDTTLFGDETSLSFIVPDGPPGDILADIVFEKENGQEGYAQFQYIDYPTLNRIEYEDQGSTLLFTIKGNNLKPNPQFELQESGQLFNCNNFTLIFDDPNPNAEDTYTCEMTDTTYLDDWDRFFWYNTDIGEAYTDEHIRNINPPGVVTGTNPIIRINGEGMSSIQELYVGTTDVTNDITEQQYNFLEFVAPTLPDGNYDIIALFNATPSTTNDHIPDLAVKNALQYFQPTQPTLSSISANTGSVTGGSSVILTGSDFDFNQAWGVEVYFGDNLASNIVVQDTNTISATVPPSTLAGDLTGTVDVKVVNPGGLESILTDEFTYTADFGFFELHIQDIPDTNRYFYNYLTVGFGSGISSLTNSDWTIFGPSSTISTATNDIINKTYRYSYNHLDNSYSHSSTNGIDYTDMTGANTFCYDNNPEPDSCDENITTSGFQWSNIIDMGFIADLGSIPVSHLRIANVGYVLAGNDSISPSTSTTGQAFNQDYYFGDEFALAGSWMPLNHTLCFTERKPEILHQAFGTAPNRVYVIEYKNIVQNYGDCITDGDLSNFQAKIYENKGPAPNPTSVSPNTGTWGSTTPLSLTIDGSDFDTTISTIKLIHKELDVSGICDITSRTSTQILCDLALDQNTGSYTELPNGEYDVEVSNNPLKSAIGGTFTITTSNTPPSISSVNPSSGPATGGTSITINGSGFSTTGEVIGYIGNTALTNIVVDPSGTSLTAETTESFQTGDQTVTIYNSDGLKAELIEGFNINTNNQGRIEISVKNVSRYSSSNIQDPDLNIGVWFNGANDASGLNQGDRTFYGASAGDNLLTDYTEDPQTYSYYYSGDTEQVETTSTDGAHFLEPASVTSYNLSDTNRVDSTIGFDIRIKDQIFNRIRQYGEGFLTTRYNSTPSNSYDWNIDTFTGISTHYRLFNFFIAGAWSEIESSQCGYVRIGTYGTAPNRVYVIEFDRVGHERIPFGTCSGYEPVGNYNPQDFSSFQVKFFESNSPNPTVSSPNSSSQESIASGTTNYSFTVTGSGFEGPNSKVYLENLENIKECSTYGIKNETTIECTAFSATGITGGTYNVVVENPDGTAGISVDAANIFYNPITLSSINGESPFTNDWGTTPANLTILGSNFTPGETNFQIQDNGTQIATCDSPLITSTDTELTCDNINLSTLGTGNYDLYIEISDGNSALFTDAIQIETPLPIITLDSVSPSEGYLNGGQTITITGSGFDNLTEIKLIDPDDQSEHICTDFLLQLDTPAVGTDTITCTTPVYNEVEALDLIGENPDGQRLVSTFTYHSRPEISSLNPVKGSTSGGITILIEGYNLTMGTTAIYLDDGIPFIEGPTNSCSSLQKINLVDLNEALPGEKGIIQCTIPPKPTPGNYSLRVKLSYNSEGSTIEESTTLPDAFEYLNQPTITSITPSSVGAISEEIIQIEGTNLEANSQVIYNSIKSENLCSWFVPDSILECQTPILDPGNYDISLLSPNNIESSNSQPLTVLAEPDISSVSPPYVSTNGNTRIQIAGANFVSGATVTFNGIPASQVDFINSGNVEAILPASFAVGPVELIVENPDSSSATLSNAFEVVPLDTANSLFYSVFPYALIDGVINAKAKLVDSLDHNISGVEVDIVSIAGITPTITKVNCEDNTPNPNAVTNRKGEACFQITSNQGGSATLQAGNSLLGNISTTLDINFVENTWVDNIAIANKDGYYSGHRIEESRLYKYRNGDYLAIWRTQTDNDLTVNSPLTYDLYIQRFDTNLNPIWANPINLATTVDDLENLPYPKHIVEDPSGNITFLSFFGSLQAIRIDGSGNIITPLTTLYTYGFKERYRFHDIASDDEGNIYLATTERYVSSPGNYNHRPMVSKYSTDLNLLWETNYAYPIIRTSDQQLPIPSRLELGEDNKLYFAYLPDYLGLTNNTSIYDNYRAYPEPRFNDIDIDTIDVDSGQIIGSYSIQTDTLKWRDSIVTHDGRIDTNGYHTGTSGNIAAGPPVLTDIVYDRQGGLYAFYSKAPYFPPGDIGNHNYKKQLITRLNTKKLDDYQTILISESNAQSNEAFGSETAGTDNIIVFDANNNPYYYHFTDHTYESTHSTDQVSLIEITTTDSTDVYLKWHELTSAFGNNDIYKYVIQYAESDDPDCTAETVKNYFQFGCIRTPVFEADVSQTPELTKDSSNLNWEYHLTGLEPNTEYHFAVITEDNNNQSNEIDDVEIDATAYNSLTATTGTSQTYELSNQAHILGNNGRTIDNVYPTASGVLAAKWQYDNAPQVTQGYHMVPDQSNGVYIVNNIDPEAQERAIQLNLLNFNPYNYGIRKIDNSGQLSSTWFADFPDIINFDPINFSLDTIAFPTAFDKFDYSFIQDPATLADGPNYWFDRAEDGLTVIAEQNFNVPTDSELGKVFFEGQTGYQKLVLYKLDEIGQPIVNSEVEIYNTYQANNYVELIQRNPQVVFTSDEEATVVWEDQLRLNDESGNPGTYVTDIFGEKITVSGEKTLLPNLEGEGKLIHSRYDSSTDNSKILPVEINGSKTGEIIYTGNSGDTLGFIVGIFTDQLDSKFYDLDSIRFVDNPVDTNKRVVLGDGYGGMYAIYGSNTIPDRVRGQVIPADNTYIPAAQIYDELNNYAPFNFHLYDPDYTNAGTPLILQYTLNYASTNDTQYLRVARPNKTNLGYSTAYTIEFFNGVPDEAPIQTDTALDSNNRLFITYENPINNTISLQRFDSSNNAYWNEPGSYYGKTVVTTGNNKNPNIVIDANDDIFLVWERENSGPNDTNILVQKFDGDGNPLWDEVMITDPGTNAHRTEIQAKANINANTLAPGVIVVWSHLINGDTEGNIYAQHIVNGIPQLAQYGQLISQSGLKNHNAEFDISSPSGNIVIVWESEDSPPDVVGQFFQQSEGSYNSTFKIVNEQPPVDNFETVELNTDQELEVTLLNSLDSPIPNRTVEVNIISGDKNNVTILPAPCSSDIGGDIDGVSNAQGKACFTVNSDINGLRTFSATDTTDPDTSITVSELVNINFFGITPPDPPTITNVTAGFQSATVEWTAPANNGGSPIIDYMLQYGTANTGTCNSSTIIAPETNSELEVFNNTDNTDCIQITVDGSTLNRVVTNLLDNEDYEFVVFAINSQGASGPSNISSTTTLNLSPPPTPYWYRFYEYQTYFRAQPRTNNPIGNQVPHDGYIMQYGEQGVCDPTLEPTVNNWSTNNITPAPGCSFHTFNTTSNFPNYQQFTRTQIPLAPPTYVMAVRTYNDTYGIFSNSSNVYEATFPQKLPLYGYSYSDQPLNYLSWNYIFQDGTRTYYDSSFYDDFILQYGDPEAGCTEAEVITYYDPGVGHPNCNQISMVDTFGYSQAYYEDNFDEINQEKNIYAVFGQYGAGNISQPINTLTLPIAYITSAIGGANQVELTFEANEGIEYYYYSYGEDCNYRENIYNDCYSSSSIYPADPDQGIFTTTITEHNGQPLLDGTKYTFNLQGYSTIDQGLYPYQVVDVYTNFTGPAGPVPAPNIRQTGSLYGEFSIGYYQDSTPTSPVYDIVQGNRLIDEFLVVWAPENDPNCSDTDLANYNITIGNPNCNEFYTSTYETSTTFSGVAPGNYKAVAFAIGQDQNSPISNLLDITVADPSQIPTGMIEIHKDFDTDYDSLPTGNLNSNRTYTIGLANGDDINALNDLDFSGLDINGEIRQNYTNYNIRGAERYTFEELTNQAGKLDIPVNFEDTSGGTVYDLGDDMATGDINLGFLTTIYGKEVDTLRIGSNGVIWLNSSTDMAASGAGGDRYSGYQMGYNYFPFTHNPSNQDSTPNNITIAGVWTDLAPHNISPNGGEVSVQTFGSYPNRRTIVHFDNVPFYGASSQGSYEGTNFQIKIYESSPDLGSARITVNQGSTNIDVSSSDTGSFQITNNSTPNLNIDSVTFDISTAILPDLLFDPTGAAGDDTFKAFTLDSETGDGVGMGTVSLENANEGGYSQITIPFTDFEPGETMSFSIDIDPLSIKGYTGANTTENISGLELTGSNITVNFSNGENYINQLRPGTTIGESLADISSTTLEQPYFDGTTLSSNPSTTDISSHNFNFNDGPAEIYYTTYIIETELRPESTYDLDPYESSAVVGTVQTVTGQSDENYGYFYPSVTLTFASPQAGINKVFHTYSPENGDPEQGQLSEIYTVKYAAPYNPSAPPLRIQSVSNSNVTVEWDPSADTGNSPLSQYRLQYGTDSQGCTVDEIDVFETPNCSSTFFAASANREFSLSGFNNIPIRFSVFAQNDAGLWTLVPNVVEAAPSGGIGAPSGEIQIHHAGGSTLPVSFISGISNGDDTSRSNLSDLDFLGTPTNNQNQAAESYIFDPTGEPIRYSIPYNQETTNTDITTEINNNGYAIINLGFYTKIYDIYVNTVSVNQYGTVYINDSENSHELSSGAPAPAQPGLTSIAASFASIPPALTDARNPIFVAGKWQNYDLPSSGTVSYQNYGDYVVIDFEDMPYYDGVSPPTGDVTSFQIKIFQNGNVLAPPTQNTPINQYNQVLLEWLDPFNEGATPVNNYRIQYGKASSTCTVASGDLTDFNTTNPDCTTIDVDPLVSGTTTLDVETNLEINQYTISGLDRGDDYQFIIFSQNSTDQRASDMEIGYQLNNPGQPIISSFIEDDNGTDLSYNLSAPIKEISHDAFVIQYGLDDPGAGGCDSNTPPTIEDYSQTPALTTPQANCTVIVEKTTNLSSSQLIDRNEIPSAGFEISVYAYNSTEDVFGLPASATTTYIPPPELTNITNNYSNVELTWLDPDDQGLAGVTDFVIQYGKASSTCTEAGGDLLNINTVNGDCTQTSVAALTSGTTNIDGGTGLEINTHTISGLDRGETYQFVIFAVNSTNESSASNMLTGLQLYGPGQPNLGAPVETNTDTTINYDVSTPVNGLAHDAFVIKYGLQGNCSTDIAPIIDDFSQDPPLVTEPDADCTVIVEKTTNLSGSQIFDRVEIPGSGYEIRVFAYNSTYDIFGLPSSPAVTTVDPILIFNLNPSFGHVDGGETVAINGQSFFEGAGGTYYEVEFTNVGSALTDHQVYFELNTQQLISSGDMDNQCSNIRVYETNGITPVPYWVQARTCNRPNTKVWVKTDLPANSTKKVIFKVESGAPYQHLGQDVFEMFEGFELDGDGDTLLSDIFDHGWINKGTGSGNITHFAGGPSFSRIRLNSATTYLTEIYWGNTTFNKDVVVEWDFYEGATGTAHRSTMFGFTDNITKITSAANCKLENTGTGVGQEGENAVYWGSTCNATPTNDNFLRTVANGNSAAIQPTFNDFDRTTSWRHARITWSDTSELYLTGEAYDPDNEALGVKQVTTTNNIPDTPLYLVFGSGSTSSYFHFMDNIFVRKHAPNNTISHTVSGELTGSGISVTFDNGTIQTPVSSTWLSNNQVEIVTPPSPLPGAGTGFVDVTLTNGLGDSYTLTDGYEYVKEPDSPILTVDNIGDQTVEISWTEPSSSSPITRYLIYYGDTTNCNTSDIDGIDSLHNQTDILNPIGGCSAVLINNPANRNHTFNTLSNNTDYHFKVYAENSTGWSAPSNPGTGTPTGFTTDVPPAPDLTVTPGNTAATATWIQSGDGGSPLTGFILRYGERATCEADIDLIGNTTNCQELILDPADRGETFTNLTNDTEYIFKLWAENAIGISTPDSDFATPSGGLCGTGAPGEICAAQSLDCPAGYPIFNATFENLTFDLNPATPEIDPAIISPTAQTTYASQPSISIEDRRTGDVGCGDIPIHFYVTLTRNFTRDFEGANERGLFNGTDSTFNPGTETASALKLTIPTDPSTACTGSCQNYDNSIDLRTGANLTSSDSLTSTPVDIFLNSGGFYGDVTIGPIDYELTIPPAPPFGTFVAELTYTLTYN